MMQCFPCRRRCRCPRHQYRQGYSRMSTTSDDSERDTILLLSSSKKTPIQPPVHLEQVRGVWSTVSKSYLRRQQELNNRINVSFSTRPMTPDQDSSLSSDSFAHQGKLYSIISEVESEDMKAEQHWQALARTFSSVWNSGDDDDDDDDNQVDNGDPKNAQLTTSLHGPSHRCKGLVRLSLHPCFIGSSIPDSCGNKDEMEVETIPEVDELSSLVSIDYSSLSIAGDESTIFPRRPTSLFDIPSSVPATWPHQPSRKYVFPIAVTGYPIQQQRRRAEITECVSLPPSDEGIVDYSNEALPKDNEEEGSTDHRDDTNTNRQDAANRERIHRLLSMSPIEAVELANASSVLVIPFSRPGAVEGEKSLYPMLGIQSAHPHWLERESTTNVWEEMEMASFFFEDDCLGASAVHCSPIQVESWTDNKWMEDASIGHSILEDATSENWNQSPQEPPRRSSPMGLESWATWMEDNSFFPSMPTSVSGKWTQYQQQRFPRPSDNGSASMDWTRKIYQPIARFAKGISTCGNLDDIDEAPFDEVEDDISRSFMEEVKQVRRKATIPPLKPNPKDSPSYAWLRQVGFPKNPLWDGILY